MNDKNNKKLTADNWRQNSCVTLDIFAHNEKIMFHLSSFKDPSLTQTSKNAQLYKVIFGFVWVKKAEIFFFTNCAWKLKKIINDNVVFW